MSELYDARWVILTDNGPVEQLGSGLGEVPGTVEKQRALRKMKLVALAFLGGAAVHFAIAVAGESNGGPGGVGCVRGAAEAGMVGALADWFAVTALFR